MDELQNFGAILKKLDELDVKDYSPNAKKTNIVKSKMSIQDPDENSNGSDFDNSDDDLADLLNDDDDDIFSKKVFGDSPLKKSESSESAKKKKEENSISFSSPERNLELSSKVALKQITTALPDDGFDATDILDDLDKLPFEKNTKPSSLKGEKARKSSILSESSDILSNLSSSKDQIDNEFSKDTFRKSSIDDDDDDIISQLNKIDKNKPAVSKERRGSFFDEFLQKLSPKHESKKNEIVTSEKQTKTIETKDDDDDDDILGSYLPTAPKNDNIIDVASKTLKKRGSLVKQVSFKDLHEEFPAKLPLDENVPISPKKDIKTESTSNLKSANKNLPVRRSQKMGANKDEEMDWSNLLNDFPEKSKPVEKSRAQKSENLPNDFSQSTKPRLGIRRQSSGAEWLGLNELDTSSGAAKSRLNSREVEFELPTSKLTRPNTARTSESSETIAKSRSNNDLEFELSTSKPTRPSTAKTSETRPRRREINKSFDDEWITELNPKPKKESTPVDLSNIFQNSVVSNEPLPSPIKSLKIQHNFANDDLSLTSDTLLESKVEHPKETDMKFSKEILSQNVKEPSLVSSSHSTFPVTESLSITNKQASDQNASIYQLQQLIENSMQERNKLMKENEHLKTVYEEKIKIMEELLNTQKKTLQDSLSTVEMNIRNEYELKMKSLEDRINFLIKEKENQDGTSKEKYEKLLKEHQSEISKLKEFYDHSINLMKEDHKEALNRIKRLKDQEIEAILSTQVHTKSLQQLSEQLEARTSELAVLQSKVEERNQFSIQERLALLDSKEKELKALQNKLQRDFQENNDEKIRLQQLVLRLESRLTKTTTEAEEDHWEVQQMKAKLAVQQKYLEEEQKLNQHHIEKEKEKLRISQDSILHEQKTVLLQLAQERQQLTQEKIELQSFAKSIKEEEAKLNIRKIREESLLQSQKQFLEEEKVKLHFEKEKLKQEGFQLERERDYIMREKQEMQRERERLNELETNIKHKSSEIEEMALAAAREKEQAHSEHSAALRLKSEHQVKVKQYTEQMQTLMDKEREILMEKEQLISERIEFERTKSSTQCIKCKIAKEKPVQAPPLQTNTIVPSRLNLNGLSSTIPQNLIDPSLIVWYITAQKDQEYLQQELTFLKSLKDSEKKIFK